MRLERTLDWAATRGYRSGPNPAKWRGNLEHLLPASSKVAPVQHHRAMGWQDVPAFVAALRGSDEAAAPALEFLILTAARSGEVIGATWDEIDLAQRLWIIPAARMKAGKEHRVPLSDRAIEIIKRQPREGERVFPGLNALSFHRLLERLGCEATTHGFRASFRGWADETSHDNHVVEMALAHRIGNAVEAAYRRSDLLEKRKRLMGDWARFVARDKIIPLKLAQG
jgi:integrase